MTFHRVPHFIKYSPATSQIEVGIEELIGEARLWIRNQGVGISEEEQVHLFERYYRAPSVRARQIEGLGLGLYLAERIVIQHGGRIWVQSAPDSGSVFFVALPLTQHAQATPEVTTSDD